VAPATQNKKNKGDGKNMNANQKAKVNMVKTVVEYCDENAAIIAAVAAFVSALSQVKAKLALLDENEQLNAVSITGIAADKNDRRKTMTSFGFDVSEMLYAYASSTDNKTLKAEVDYPMSAFTRMRDSEIAVVCRTIHDRGVENVNTAKDFGINTDLLADFLTAIEAYEASLTKPRTAIGKRKTHKANIAELIREIDEILTNQMDKMMSKFRTTHPDFYETYFNLREIIDPTTTHTQLKGTITDAADGKPLGNATITIVEQSKTASSDPTGKYTIKPAPFGKFTVTVTKPGYTTFQKEDVSIKVGESTVLNVSLS